MRIANAFSSTGSLPFVRRFLAAALTGLVLCSAYAQRREGVYRPVGGQPTPWKIDDQGTLVWGAEPYLPVGARIEANAESIAAAKKAGVKDVIVDLPASGAGWAETFASLEAAGMRYVLRIGSMAPLAHGYAIEPQGYRISGIRESKSYAVPIAEATSAFVVLANQQSGMTLDAKRVPVKNGILTYEVGGIPAVDHVLLIYPELKGLEAPDFWRGLDEQRDTILGSLRRFPPGKGLRAIVNPLGRLLNLPGRDIRFVPNDPAFHEDFASMLEGRYKSMETLFKQWSMSSSDLSSSFMKEGKAVSATWLDVARLVPLWSTTRGASLLWDPKTDKTYVCENKKSRIWADLSDAIHAVAQRRIGRLVASIHGVTDVPILQEWEGWVTPYETSQPGFDGIGVRTTGSRPSQIIETASRAASTTFRWTKPGWFAATDVELSADSLNAFPGVTDDLTSMGARAVFLHTDSPGALQTVADTAKRIAENAPLMSVGAPIYFPENAMNPAAAQRLVGSRWWLPTPTDGNRIDMGSSYFAYRISDFTGHKIVLWAKQPGRVLLRVVDPKPLVFTSCDGSNPNPKPTRGGVEVTLNEWPLVISGSEEIPVPDPAYKETETQFSLLTDEAARRHRDLSEDRMAFREAVDGFERNPGGSFSLMRQVLRRASISLASYVWIEAERTSDNNFSEAVSGAGCSGAAALALRTTLTPEGGYVATYTVPVRSRVDQEVWIAARIPAEKRNELTVNIGGQELTITGDGQSPYGNGFAWYKLGVTRLSGNSTKLKVNVVPTGASDLALDAILITPYPFRPNGVQIPDALDYSAMIAAQQKKPK